MLTKAGHYHLQRCIGKGGMGAVHEGVHEMTGRRVAVKTLLPHMAARPDLQGRFFTEAWAISLLEHPGIVRVHDVGRSEDGTAYMVMELVEGRSLARLFTSGELPGDQLWTLLRRAAEAIAHAHDKGIIHRDLKPDNVMVIDTPSGLRPKVLDFGIAKILEGEGAGASPSAIPTITGAVFGTPTYMSPEQCRGRGGITAESDVYSFGVMCYQLCAGRPPFEGGVGEVIAMHLGTEPLPLVQLRPELPLVVSELVTEMLAKVPSERPSMSAVAARLREIELLPRPLLSSTGPTLPAISPLLPTERPSSPPSTFGLSVGELTDRPKEGPPRLIAPIAALLLLLGAAGLWWRTRSDTRTAGGAVTQRAAAQGSPSRAAALGPPLPPTPTSAPEAPSRSAPVAPARVIWVVESAPAGAQILRARDGAILGTTPYRTELNAEPGEEELVLRLTGFLDHPARLGRDRDGRVLVKLKPRRSRAAPASPPDDELQVEALE